MRKPILQRVTLPASATKLYRMYVDPRLHAAFTGAPARIGEKPGATFSAFGGELWGEILGTKPGRMVVQTWRSSNFRASDPDSILVLSFAPVSSRSARIELLHANVPAGDYAGVTKGWPKYYWRPWRRFLTRG